MRDRMILLCGVAVSNPDSALTLYLTGDKTWAADQCA